ncbi:MAG: VTT domain-containing protein, partial [Caulobacteraceae bacterium]
VPGSVAATIGVTLGGCIAFLVARLAVGDSLEKGVGPRIRALEEGFKKDAFFYLMTLRLLPVMPFWVVNVAAGLLSIRLSTFFLATLVGIFPVGVVYAGLGSGLGRMFDRGLRPDLHSLITPELILPLAGLAVLSVLPILYHQWRGRRAAAAAFVADDAGVQ